MAFLSLGQVESLHFTCAISFYYLVLSVFPLLFFCLQTCPPNWLLTCYQLFYFAPKFVFLDDSLFFLRLPSIHCGLCFPLLNKFFKLCNLRMAIPHCFTETLLPWFCETHFFKLPFASPLSLHLYLPLQNTSTQNKFFVFALCKCSCFSVYLSIVFDIHALI